MDLDPFFSNLLASKYDSLSAQKVLTSMKREKTLTSARPII